MSTKGAAIHRGDSRLLERGIVLLVVLLALWHLIQGWGPLRLSADAVHLLQVAGSAADGAGYMYQGTPTYYPHGYPALIAAVDRAGLGVSWVIFGLNYMFAGCGLWAVYRIARGPYQLQGWIAALVVALTLLSYVFVKHLPLPMSDVPYFGLSTLSVYFLTLATSCRDSRRWLPLATGMALAVLAIWFRTVGIALVPAVLWAAFSANNSLTNPIARFARHRLGAVALGLVGLASAAFVIVRTQAKYLQELAAYAATLNQGEWAEVLGKRASAYGELFLNVPESRIPSGLEPFFTLAGTLAVVLFGYGLWLRWRHFSAVDAYAFTYLGIVTVWPAGDARFLLPVFPLLLLWGIGAVRHLVESDAARNRTILLAIYLLGFGFAGTAALTYSTSLTFAGGDFPTRYGNGSFVSEYRIAFEGPYPAAASDFIPALEVLLRYEPRTNAYFRESPDFPRLSPELKETLLNSPGKP